MKSNQRNLTVTNQVTSDCQSGDCDCGPSFIPANFSRRQFVVATGVLAAGLGSARSMAADNRKSYAAMLKSDPSLRGYWRFDGDLVDVMDRAPAKASSAVTFVDGVAGGKAIRLTPNKPLSVRETNHLRGRSATLELFFKVGSTPRGKEDIVLIAQTSGQSVRYLVGVKNDLSALVYRNEKQTVLTTIHLPTARPIEVGRWYHLAITGYDLDLRAYIDGYECSLVGGAFEFTRRGPKKSTMTFGATTVNGWGSGDILLDEVACYAKGLTQADIQSHLEAAGWEQRLKETGEIVADVKSERDAVRERKKERVLSDPGLTAPGKTRVYEGDHLDAINFIVGGIGAGGIQFNGKAEPAIWQIACNFNEVRIADSFLAVRAMGTDGKPLVRALQTTPIGPFTAMKSLKFEGEYPLAKYHFEEPALPVEVGLEVFNPFIPMDLKNSAIPCAIYNVTVTNPSSSAVKVDVLATQKNALGYTESGGGGFGKNHNKIVREGDTTLLHMTRKGIEGSDMVLMTRASGATGSASWESTDSLHVAFTKDGRFEGPNESKVSPARQTVNGSISAPMELAPGQSKTVTYVLTWFFEDGKHGSGKKPVKLEGEAGQTVGWTHEGQNYTNWWSSARNVASFLQSNLDELTSRTRGFHDTLYESNLPVWLLDRLSSQLAVLRSQTCWWASDGFFGAWEGCNPTAGCCAGNCTHVWHYAQAHARLLPELGRKMREQDYSTLTSEGLLPHRHTNKSPAADGHFGTILNTYREHLCSADESWLKSQWPKVKKTMTWAIKHWDPNQDGYMANIQHNTLDGAFTGCSSWIGTLYLSALEAAARMAETMGDKTLAADYRKIRASGKKLQNDRLWNGEYYVQEVGKERAQDYLDGCHIDQILGEWWADQVGIDDNYPQDRAHMAMASLLKYNFLADFHGQSLKPRQYCEVEDGGMKMITWPKNPQPIPGMKYGDEVMTGFEYGAAATMIQKGLLREGLMVVKAIADRYDGRLRTEGVTDMKNGPWGYSGNPFGDDECGKFYGRSLSVWSVLLALQGFDYDGPAGRIGFRPRLNPDDHASFFTAAESYGLFSQTQHPNDQKVSIWIREGNLRLNEVILWAAEGKRPQSVQVTLAGEPVDARLDVLNLKVRLAFEQPLVMTADQQLAIDVQLV